MWQLGRIWEFLNNAAPKEKIAHRKKIVNLLFCFMKIILNIRNKKVVKQKAKNGILMYAAVIIPKQKAMDKPTKGYFIFCLLK